MNTRRRVEGGSSPYKEIDLGLPSGLIWCDRNVGSTNPLDPGYYFSWGNVDPMTYVGPVAYNGSPGQNIGEKPIPLSQDAARKYMEHGWRMPTYEEYLELVVYTRKNVDRTFVTVNGVYCLKVYNTTDNSKYILFPVTGYYTKFYDDSPITQYSTDKGFCWAKTPYETMPESYARQLYFYDTLKSIYYMGRHIACPIRAVKIAGDNNGYTAPATVNITYTLESLGQGSYTVEQNNHKFNLVGNSYDNIHIKLTLSVTCSGTASLTFTIAASTENGYDIGYVGAIGDTNASKSNNVLSASGTSVNSKEIIFPAGTSIIQIGYQKDGSSSGNNDMVTITIEQG